MSRAPRGASFSTRLRLTKRAQFQAIYTAGLRVAGKRMVIFAVRSAEGGARLGITATRKVGGSVVRNRTRRLVREAFRRNVDQFATLDLVVNVRSDMVRSGLAEVETELLGLAARARRRVASSDERPA